MNVPKVRIGWVIAIVAIAALNFEAIRVLAQVHDRIYSLRTVDEYRAFERISKLCFVLEFGALPIANILAVGLLIGFWRRGSRRFLWGFETLGLTALALFIALASFFTDELLWPYLNLVIEPIVRAHGAVFTTIEYRSFEVVLAAMLVLPQIAIALIGGFLSRHGRIAIRSDTIHV